MRRTSNYGMFVLLALCGIGTAHAGGIQTLETVTVIGSTEDLFGIASSATQGTVSAAQLEERPLLRPAEVLEAVPGLIVSQHSGDGKANQYYLRGFNLDHGTDFAISMMGMPVNMPTHGHGQGYADLNFLIPELVERMQYRKGPYSADQGDFASAGSASIEYFRKLDAPYLDLGMGENGYRRALLAGSSPAGGGQLLHALEWAGNDGPWNMPQNLDKINGLLRYGEGTRDNGWSLAAMAYQARWRSTDQVPQRAIDSGLIGRYDNLDPTDGGQTHRYSLSGEWSAREENIWRRANAYFIDYSLNLWSNFSFCSTDPNPATCLRGDQFEQGDRRQVYGFNGARTWYGNSLGLESEFTFGVQSRYDHIGKLGLYTTTARQKWGTVREDAVDEASISLYGESQVQWHDKFRSILGLRGDFYRFNVASDLAANSGRASDRMFSPKLALIFGPWSQTEYYLNAGYGFHSNDARGVTAKLNPDFRDTANYLGALDSSTPLVRTKAYELGLRSAIAPNLQTSLALWRLDSASELVFVGDAGTTEAGFPSQRSGIEWANYWTPMAGLTVDADLALSRARFTEVDASVPGNYIPGAIERAISVGVTINSLSHWSDGHSHTHGHAHMHDMETDSLSRWSGGLRLRHFGSRPLTEDNSVRSKPSTLVNLQAGYKFDRKTRLTLEVLNLFDRKVSDIDYWYESQLAGEAAPVADIHTHPAEPRSLRLVLRVGL